MIDFYLNILQEEEKASLLTKMKRMYRGAKDIRFLHRSYVESCTRAIPPDAKDKSARIARCRQEATNWIKYEIAKAKAKQEMDKKNKK